MRWNLIQLQLQVHRGQTSLGEAWRVPAEAGPAEPGRRGLRHSLSLLSSLTLPSLGGICFLRGPCYTDLPTQWRPVRRAQHISRKQRKSPGLGFQTLGPRVSVQLDVFSKCCAVHTPNKQRMEVTAFHTPANTWHRLFLNYYYFSPGAHVV